MNSRSLSTMRRTVGMADGDLELSFSVDPSRPGVLERGRGASLRRRTNSHTLARCVRIRRT